MPLSVQTERMRLEPLGLEHRAEVIRVHEVSREHFRPWFPSPPADHSLELAFDEALARAQSGSETGTELRLVGVLDGGVVAGFFSLNQIFRRAFKNAYAGWSVSADQVGRGLATEGVGALLDVAFAPEPVGLALHRVQANVIPANVASVRVAEKAGFRLEGTALRYLQINGRWQDHLMFAKTVEEHTLRYLG